MNKELLGRLLACYGTWGFQEGCHDCQLAAVCNIYSEKRIFNSLAQLLLYEDGTKERNYHKIVERLLADKKFCKEMVAQDVMKLDELKMMNLASRLNLDVCKKCESGCVIKLVLKNCCVVEEQLKSGNLPDTASDIKFPPDDCPYLLEHTVSKDA
jgi:hypothetical protein